jgi:predicted sulfurtransferase
MVRNLPQLSACPDIDFKLVSLGGFEDSPSLNGHLRGAGLLVKIVEELVALKCPRETAHWTNSGIPLSPRNVHAALSTADVLIDVRNGYESDIGHFVPPLGVELLLPGTRTFSEVSNAR